MRKPIMIALAVLTMVACKKKSEDPKPEPVVVVTPVAAPKHRPMTASQPSCSGGSVRAEFLRTEAGKDVYRITELDARGNAVDARAASVWVSGGSYFADGLKMAADGSWELAVGCRMRW